MIKIAYLLSISLLFTQCFSSKPKLGVELLPLEQTVTITSIDEYIQDIEYILPDVNHFSFSGRVLFCKNGDFIESDKDGNISLFDSKGQFKRIITRYGNGHREYSSRIDFALSKNEDCLLILESIKVKMYGIKDSTYYKEIKLSTVIAADAIAPSDDDNIFLYAAYSSNANSEADDYLVSKIDQNGDVMEQFLKRDDHTFTIGNITQSYGNRYYLRPQNAHHIFYKFDNGLTPAYQINFGAKNIPYQHNYQPMNNDIVAFMSAEYYKLPIYFYETKDNLYFSAVAGDADKHNYLYFKNKGKGINWKDSKEESLIIPIASDENYFYFMYNGVNLRDYNKENPNLNTPLFRYISDVFINKWKFTGDDDVIVKVKFH